MFAGEGLGLCSLTGARELGNRASADIGEITDKKFTEYSYLVNSGRRKRLRPQEKEGDYSSSLGVISSVSSSLIE